FHFSDLQLSITPMLVTGEITVSGYPAEPIYVGSLAADDFDVITLLESLDLKEPGPAAGFGLDEDRMLSFSTRFNGSAQRATLSDFDLKFAGSLIEADAEVRLATDLAPLNISYNVNAGALDLSPFFTEQQTAAGEIPTSLTETAQYQPQAELPVELMSSISLLGGISVESVTINGIRLQDIKIFTNIEDGVLDIEVPPISLFEGSTQGTLRLSTRGGAPEVEVTQTISKVSLSQLSPLISRFNGVSGFLQAESSYTATGDTVEEMLDSLSGNSAFSVTDSSVDIGVIKQVFTAIAALSPNGEAIQQWPDVIRFGDMSGYLILEDGLNSQQEIRLRMDNFDISGSGRIDPDAQTFDYDLLFTVLGAPYTQTIPINELYHNVPWPVDCSAAFADDVSRYCRADFTRVRDIFSQIGSNALHNELQDIITDQVPEQFRDSARGLLRSLLN
ncbi:MAG: AsmA family protein, partial [Pseudomonadota bacterium]|nr:AsmA family protein [Pseudomonadota bacterium]